MQNPHGNHSANEEILQEIALGYPQVIKDYTNARINKHTAWEHFLNSCPNPIKWQQWNKITLAWNISKLLSGLDLEYPIFNALPESNAAHHNVLVISTPRLNFPTTTGHWSLFCQGKFYHLTAPGLVNDTVNGIMSGPGLTEVPVVLKVEDFSSPDAEDSRNFSDHNKALVAYHVGRTAYTPEIIETIARWIISKLQTYDLLSQNCQMFVLSLLDRIVMTAWDGSVFVGDKTQIASWDLQRSDTTRQFFSRQSGYLIRKPYVSPIPSTTNSLLSSFRMGTYHDTSGIRGLYQGKPRFDPTGKNGRLKYSALYVVKAFKSEDSIGLKRALKEFFQDVASGRIRDAFVGRLETRLEQWDAIKREIDDGIYAEGSRYVAVQKRILSIPPEHL